jgi:hypothetical protein
MLAKCFERIGIKLRKAQLNVQRFCFITVVEIYFEACNSAVNTANPLRAGRLRDKIPVGVLSANLPTQALGSIQPLVRWVPGVFLGGNAAGTSFTNFYHKAPKLKK